MKAMILTFAAIASATALLLIPATMGWAVEPEQEEPEGPPKKKGGLLGALDGTDDPSKKPRTGRPDDSAPDTEVPDAGAARRAMVRAVPDPKRLEARIKQLESIGYKDVEPIGWYLLAKFAMARVALARYVPALHAAGLVRGAAADDNRALLHIDPTCAVVGRGALETGVHQNQELPPFYDLTEEVGRLLGAHARTACRIYLGHLDRSLPLWYLSEAPKQQATEHRTSPLQHYGGNVLAQYWVLGRTREAFTRYVDTTRFLGDLYYVRNLAAAIDSFSAAKGPE